MSSYKRRQKIVLKTADIDSLETPKLHVVFERAAKHLTEETIGACWRHGQRRFSFLPESGRFDQTYFILKRNGRKTRLGAPSAASYTWDRSNWPYLPLFVAMDDLRLLLAKGQPGRAPAQAIILRPTSLLALRYHSEPGAMLGGNERHPESRCDLFFSPNASGHDQLEEPLAIERDFPGIFEIET